MKFEIDNQTLKDLDIFTSDRGDLCVFDCFNFTESIGGRDKLRSVFDNPTSNREVIEGRKEFIKFVCSLDNNLFEVNKNDLDFIEYYLKYGDKPSTPPSLYSAIENIIIKKVTGQNNELYIIKRGILFTLFTFQNFFNFIDSLSNLELPGLLLNIKRRISTIRESHHFQNIMQKEYLVQDGALSKISILETAKIDHIIRSNKLMDTRYIIDAIYEFDALFAIKKAMESYRLTLPEIGSNPEVSVTGICHPFIKNPVRNNVRFSFDENTMFISGPNMAGKSTLLKSMGICIFLAHCGLPVPAENMSFSPLCGLYSTINLPDKLNQGQSHFYAEVLRLKQIAERLQEKDRFFIIFDELFRGTNVKDAYEGSLAVIKSFSKIKSSYFIISTHIVELTKQLKDIASIQFKYLESLYSDGDYKYSYKLMDGVSEDRLGMYIIEKEGLLELLDKVPNHKKSSL